MTYMSVKSKNADVLHLVRGPGLRSWGVFMGILSIGFGVVFFSREDESVLWKVFCFCCSVLGAFLSLDDWEECILDKKNDQVQLKRLSLVEKAMYPRGESTNVVTAFLSHVTDVRMEEEDVRYFGRARYLLLVFRDGYSLPLTVKATKGSGENHLAILKVIQDFLHIEESERPQEVLQERKEETDEDDSSSSSSSASSFEKIPADVTEEMEGASKKVD